MCARLQLLASFINSQSKFQCFVCDLCFHSYSYICCLHSLKPSVHRGFLFCRNVHKCVFIDTLSLPSSAWNCLPVLFSSAPIFLFSLLGLSGQSVNWLSVSLLTSAQSQTPFVDIVNPQEMAVFGSTQPPLCLGCQAN